MIKEIGMNFLTKYQKFKLPHNLKNNQIHLTNSQFKELETSIKENFHTGWRKEKNYTPKDYEIDLNAHLYIRLDFDRLFIIPWINETIKLDGSNILEIGCGTGSSTVALAEQGSHVTGVDIDEGAMEVAKERCEIYDVPFKSILNNATDAYEDLKDENFDLIIFFACLEHMTYNERIDSLKKYYELLPKGGFLSIVETPNRLWYFDRHTSHLPFYNWLPDELAYDYSKFSKRDNFSYPEFSDEQFLNFLRRGRGFSFHELQLAINLPPNSNQIVSSISMPYIPYSQDSRYHKFLTKSYPDINKVFFNPSINIIIKK